MRVQSHVVNKHWATNKHVRYGVHPIHTGLCMCQVIEANKLLHSTPPHTETGRTIDVAALTPNHHHFVIKISKVGSAQGARKPTGWPHIQIGKGAGENNHSVCRVLHYSAYMHSCCTCSYEAQHCSCQPFTDILETGWNLCDGDGGEWTLPPPIPPPPPHTHTKPHHTHSISPSRKSIRPHRS